MVDCVTGFLFLICEFIKLMLRYSAAVATGDGVTMTYFNTCEDKLKVPK